MKTIIHDDFMLQTKTARELYHTYAEKQPIIDYHCHLNPAWIAEDHTFSDIGELMLAGDHYKWRAMRSFGIDEKYITGDSTWREKFRAFAETIPYCIGNPLYHWTHLELKRYFDIDEALTKESADRIFDACTAKLQEEGYSAKGLIERSGVKVVCTTDDPIDTLEYHEQIAKSSFAVKVYPAFRPDKAINIHKDTFLPYIESAGVKTYAELKAWLDCCMDFFHAHGCRISDHGLDFIPYKEGTEAEAAAVFDKALNMQPLTEDEIQLYMTDLLLFFARGYNKRGWCMQIHVGAIRNNNTAMYNKMGADTGFDSIAATAPAAPLAKLMDALALTNDLPKTILYSLDPNDTYALGTLMGCFQQAPFRSKIQLGSAWWFNDQKDGMEAQLRAFGNLGVLGAFIGMLTDSRSFISYPRHEYFRRILCNLIGNWVEEGQYPDDREKLGEIITGICYENAEKYFHF
ncbi:MAG: glucuronate isomerase, partial [Eubacteriales bacterium]